MGQTERQQRHAISYGHLEGGPVSPVQSDAVLMNDCSQKNVQNAHSKNSHSTSQMSWKVVQ